MMSGSLGLCGVLGDSMIRFYTYMQSGSSAPVVSMNLRRRRFVIIYTYPDESTPSDFCLQPNGHTVHRKTQFSQDQVRWLEWYSFKPDLYSRYTYHFIKFRLDFPELYDSTFSSFLPCLSAVLIFFNSKPCDAWWIDCSYAWLVILYMHVKPMWRRANTELVRVLSPNQPCTRRWYHLSSKRSASHLNGDGCHPAWPMK